MKELAEIVTDALVDREARVRQGKVTSIQAGPPRTVTVNVSGTDYPNIRCMSHVDPVVAENVWMLDMGIGRWLIFGTTSNSLNRPGYVKVAGDTMTGTLTVPNVSVTGSMNFPNTGVPFMTAYGDSSWMGFYNAGGGSRRGYLQGNSNGLVLNSEAGLLTLNGVGGLSLSNFTINGYAASTGVAVNRIVLAQASGYIYGNYFNMTANVASGWPTHFAGMTSSDNFLRWYDKNATLQIPGSSQTSGYTWSIQDFIVYTAGNQAGIALYPTPYGTAPIFRCFGAFGERLDAVNNANSAYASLNASAFNVQSSIRIKQDISEIDDKELLSKISQVKAHRWFPKVRPLVVRPSERFKTLDAKWQASGKTPLTVTPKHLESHDHDCDLDGCNGTSENPCIVIQNDTMRIGLIAEHLHEVAPEATNIDLEGLPESYDVSQVASMAFGGVGALTRQVQELMARVAELEGAK